MEKYGVETEKEKEREKKGCSKCDCPTCGCKLNKDAPKPHCKKCGTEPFES